MRKGKPVLAALLTLLLAVLPGSVMRAEEGEPAVAPDGTPPRIAYAYVNDAVVTVELEEGDVAADYCFTVLDTSPPADAGDWLSVNASVFRTFKVDGDYFIFVRDENGLVSEPYPISVRSGFRYVIRAEGMQALRMPLTDMLQENGTTVDALNRAVTADIAEAGFYTRCGVLTAGVSAISHMAEFGYTIPYQGQGAYQKADNWGFNPNWGGKLPYPTRDGNGVYHYEGMQCIGAIVWAHKQAGVNVSNAKTGYMLGWLGIRERGHNNRLRYNNARGGDIVIREKHGLMIVDRLDTDGDGMADSYLTYEMEHPHLSLLILSFPVVRAREFYDMSSVYENVGRYREYSREYEDTYLIPREQMPAYVVSAMDGAEQNRALDRLMRGLGLTGAEENTLIGREG